MKKTLLPNGNDLLLALLGRDVIRRKVTMLENFVSAEEWFAKPERERKAILDEHHHLLCSTRPRGVWLEVRTVWAWFRGEPRTGILEVSFDKETWEPFPWPSKEEGAR